MDPLRHTAPDIVWATLLAYIFQAEHDWAEKQADKSETEDTQSEQRENDAHTHYGMWAPGHTVLTTRLINQWTTYPVPTKNTWQAATKQDPDLGLIIATTSEDPIPPQVEFQEKEYHDQLEKGHIFHEEGIVYHTEMPRGRRVRQVVWTVVPQQLRRVIFSAYHASPMVGHTGVFKTYWRIAV